LLDDFRSRTQRREAYDRCLADLKKIDPGAKPIASYGEVFAAERVSAQARDTVAPEPLPPSSEHRLVARISAMQGSCAELVSTLTKLGAPTPAWPEVDADPLERLQSLNAFFDRLERKVAYWRSTSKEQRAIDTLRMQVAQLEKRAEAQHRLLSTLVNDLIPQLMKAKK
jgi:hypothetical protein